MTLSVSFFGAARNVTGSRHLVETHGSRVLVDCGLYQERHNAARNWEPFAVLPASIDAVVLTHAHIDHAGWLPRLVRTGFDGPAYCSSPTQGMLPAVLADSARLQAEDVALKRKRHAAEQRASRYPVEPMYDEEDVEAACRALRPLAFGAAATVAPGVTATLLPTGHILGAAMVLLEETATGERVLFSGDLGRKNRPLLPDPAAPPPAELLVVESTYGDRVHAAEEDVASQLEEVILGTLRGRGSVLIPCFAVERAHELIYYLQLLRRAGRIPRIPVFLDSPMAVRLLEVYRAHPEAMDEETRSRLAQGDSPFSLPELELCVSREESKRINRLREPAIIIAGSGMCTGGRIKHHLLFHLERKESTLVFVGYQASGTLGRQLLDGAREVRLFGRMVRVRLGMRQIHGFSGHADRNELLAWIGRMPGGPRRVAVVHGGSQVSTRFASDVAAEFRCMVEAPEFGDKVTVGG
jgi:metallo-beta-lactamase family protein